MQPIATDVALSVVMYLSVCWLYGCFVQERLNRSRCRLRADSGGLREPCIIWWSRSPHWKRQLLRVVQPV